MQLSIKTNFKDVSRWLGDVQKQVPFATALALTKTAQEVREGHQKTMRQVFDRPTQFTLGSLYLQRATKQRLEARVWLKDGARKQHYLLPQIEGGYRPPKRFEERLVRIGVMGASERSVPGSAAQIDSSGNMSRGQIVKILSQLGSQGVHGDTSMATNSRRSRAKRARTQYFVSRGPGEYTGAGSWKNGKHQHLPRGIWERTVFSSGTAVRPVLIFVSRANYRKVFDFFGIANRVIGQRFEPNFTSAMQVALKTARPPSAA